MGLLTEHHDEQHDKREEDALRQAQAILTEHFGKAVIMAESRAGMTWRYNDRTWAWGACERLKARLDEDDRCHARDNWEP